MNRGRSVFAARLDPFNRLAQPHREMGTECLLGVEIELRTESAADFGRDDADLVFGHADHTGQ